MPPVRFLILILTSSVSVSSHPENTLLAGLGPNSPWIVNNLVSSHVDGAKKHAHFSGTPFTMSRDVDHGETEYRVFHDGIVAMETVMTRHGERGLFFREVTDGKKILKMFYSGRQGLVECDIQKNMLDVDDFLAEFLATKSSHVGRLRHAGERIDISSILGNTELFGKNAVYHVTEDDVLREPYASLVDIELLRNECVELHRHIKHRLREAGLLLGGYREVMTREDREVSREFVPRRVKRTKRGASNRRTKRGIIIPDTKWCGAGSENENFEDVGPSRATDRCCREHDHCPYYIEAMSKKYNLFNARLYTISHCYCDEVFRTCLKDANTDQSAMVGRVYFNLLGMKCFEFEMEEVCAERSWWGWCQRTEEQIVAKVRGSLSWT